MHARWTARNRCTHDEDISNPEYVVRKVREDLLLLELPLVQRRVMAGQCWRPPDPGWITINTDGAIDFENRTGGGGGGVVRSHFSFMGAWSKPFPGVTDSLIIEALALREGVILAKLRGFSHVVMEMDTHTHNSIGGSQVTTTPSRVQRPKSNNLSNFTSTNLCGEHKPMHLMQWQEQKCSNPSLSNPTKSN